MAFIHDDFLLHSAAARSLYHEHAAPQPILDYHNHLSPADIAENRNFDLAQIWLGDDHYKWRAMRAAGVEERLITGDAEPYDRFLAWARTVPKTLRNPLYHWTHLELKRTFGIDELLNEDTAPAIWEEANRQLATPELSTQGILKKFNVVALCTTDDPVDSLEHHAKMASQGLKVYPAFRPDRALEVDRPTAFNAWTDRLATAANQEIATFDDFQEVIRRRHDAFHAAGGRLSDHGLERCHVDFPTEAEASAIFLRARADLPANPQQQDRFASFMMLLFARLDAEKGWTKQLHLGALRNVRTNAPMQNAGYDAIGDFRQAEALAAYLDRLDREGALPQTIVYNNNPVDNDTFSTLAGCFERVRFGAAWWFLDTKDGIERQLDALSDNGLLSNFVGMLTDSRSFMSFPRHEYFRRVLCNLLGGEVERGELPNDLDLLGALVEDVCFRNADRYLGLTDSPLPSGGEGLGVRGKGSFAEGNDSSL